MSKVPAARTLTLARAVGLGATLLIGSGGFAVPAVAQELEAGVPDIPVSVRTLGNGLRLVALPRETSPTVAFVVYTAVGGVNEQPGETGIAHLLEHLLFKGTTTIGTRSLDRELELFPQIDATFDSLVAERDRVHGPDLSRQRLLEERLSTLETRARRFVNPNELDRIYAENGARGLNATTTAEETVYFVELPANRLELWMILEADRRLNPVLREFHTERNVVLEERAMRVDSDPAGMLAEAHLAAAFTRHPYGQPVVGIPEDLQHLDRPRAEDYFQRFYGARNTVIAIVGDIDIDATLDLAERYFSPLPPGEVPAPVAVVEPPQSQERRIRVLFDAEPRIRLGWHIPSDEHADGPALNMLAAVLTAGRTSRLYRRLVTEEKLASSIVSATAPGNRYPRLFIVEGLPSAGHDVSEIERAVEEELARLRESPPNEIELMRVRNQLKAGAIRRLRSNLSLAFELAGTVARSGDWRELFRQAQRMVNVTPEDVQRVVATYLTPSQRTVAVLERPSVAQGDPETPAVSRDAAPSSGEPRAQTAPRRGRVATGIRPGLEHAPGGPAIGRDAALAFRPPPLEYEEVDPVVERIRGVSVVFLEDRSLPLASMFFRLGRGFSHLPREQYGAVTALSSMLQNGGTRTLPPDSVALRVELLAMENSFSSTGEAMASGFNVLAQDLDEGLDLWRQVLLEPRFDSTEIEIWRNKELDFTRRSQDSPQSVAYSRFNNLMFGDNPIGWDMGPDDLTPERVNATTLAAAHRALFCRDRLMIGVAGDVDWPRMRSRLDDLLESWPPCAETLPDAPRPTVRDAGGIFLIPRKVDQATIVIGQPSTIHEGDREDYFASRVANAILGSSGMSSRLMNRIRTEKGYAYGATSTWTTPRRSDGILAVVTNSRSETAADAAASMLDVLREMSEQAPEESEVRSIREEITNGMVFTLQSASQVVQRRMTYLASDLPTDWLETYLKEVQRVSPEDVLRVIRSQYDPSKLTWLVVGDPDILLSQLQRFGPVTVLEDPEAVTAPVGSGPSTLVP